MKIKKSKTSVWQEALSLAVVLTLALGSCTKEPLGLSKPSGDSIEVRVTFAQNVTSKATTDEKEEGSPDENKLNHMTILVFNRDDGKLETVLSEDVSEATSSLNTTQPRSATNNKTFVVGPLINKFKPKVIYAIANWSTKQFDKSTYTEAMLKEEFTTIAAVEDINVDDAMLMSGSTSVTNINSTNYNVTVNMARQVSKIRVQLTIPVKVQNDLPNIEWQTKLMTMMLVNIPNKSYVIGSGVSPADVTFLNSDIMAVDYTEPAATNQVVPLIWNNSIYINENPIVGISPGNSTYIVVQLPYKDRLTNIIYYDNYYKLIINNTQDNTSPHAVLRNTIYNLDISIVEIGLPLSDLEADKNVDGQLTVNSWEQSEIGSGLNYFNIDRNNIVFQNLETVHCVALATDVADWKLINKDGVTILSFAENKMHTIVDGVSYMLDGTKYIATINIQKTAETNFPEHKMFIVANNLKVPFTVRQ